MFGILYTVSAIVGRCAASIKDASFDCKSKSKAIQNNKERYFDHNGASRLVNNGKHVYDAVLKNGDRVTKDINGNIIKNIDKPIRNQVIEQKNIKLAQENAPVRCIGYFYDLYTEEQRKGLLKYIPKKQEVYESLNNKNRYIRQLSRNNQCPLYVYINLNNGEFEFLDDYDLYASQWLEKQNKNRTEHIIVRRI